jgi:hypothetical protein
MRLVVKKSRKRYFGKAVYEYDVILLPIPSKYRDAVKPFLGRDLEVVLSVEGDRLNISARPVDAKTSKKP